MSSSRSDPSAWPAELALQVEEACNRFEAAWRAGDRPRIEAYLGETSEPGRLVLLRELLAVELEYRLGSGDRPTPGEYDARFPGHAELVHEVFARAPSNGPQVTGVGAAGTPSAPTSGSTGPYGSADASTGASGAGEATGGGDRPTQAAGRRSRFTPLRRHAQGGLGTVSLAFDETLRRQVALKEIRPDRRGSAQLRQRFLAEAEITGRLEHPGIVPIYALEEDAEGQPYYAMRFIQGRTLAEAIQAYHARPTPLDFHALLKRFIDVCQTIAYAHSKGVIHRDLKPANVMLGDYGETLVVDWGLAKRVGGGREAQGGKGDEPVPAGGGSGGPADPLTEAGQVLGTPAYMSPEQAEGRSEDVAPAADVYALGAILFELLTGQPPYRGGGMAAVLAQVRQGPPRAPAQVRPGVPRALEAVCLKAMARSPADRYAGAGEVAREVERFLADEPLTAYREPFPVRLARWRRRHPTLVTATGLVLLTLVGAAVIGGVVVGREQQARLEQQRKAREAQVGTLLDVTPQAVPAILAALEPYRDEIRPLLRQAAEQPEAQEATAEATRLWRQHRARAGLALLAEDPGQVAPLTARLREEGLDPAEMLLVRDALRPHAAELKDDLWRRASEGSAAGRFRALVALAAYDPGAARWEHDAAGAVGGMLSANPLHLGQWVEALRPVRGQLVAPLGRVFRGVEPGLADYRQVAASVLTDYAADQPDTLTALLLVADERQYAVLLPKVQAHRDRAVTRLTAELDRALTPDWHDAPLDPAWGAADAALVRQVEAAEGLVAERFALCLTLPVEQLDAVAGGLAKSGYRLVQFRPYAVATSVPLVGSGKPTSGTLMATGRLLVAALWTRDGRAAHWALGLTVDAVTKRDAEEQGRGLVPLDVTDYLVPGATGAAAERYATVWGPKEPGQAAVRLYAGLPAAKLEATKAALRQEPFWPRTQGYVQVGAEARHAGIWVKAAGPPEDLLFEQGVLLGGTEAAYEGVQSPSNLQVDLRLGWDPNRLAETRGAAAALLGATPAAGLASLPWGALALSDRHRGQGPPEVTFAAVWRCSGERVSKAVSGLDPAAQRGRWRELVERGYRPAAVTAVAPWPQRSALASPPASSEARTLVATGSVWHLPVIPEADKDALAKRQAQAAVALLQLGAPERVWPLLEHKPDPRLRSFLIHRFAPLQADVRALLDRLAEEGEVSRRRALVLSLGSYPVEALPAEARGAWLPRLRQWYRAEPDAGLHGAVEWLLRRWGDGVEVARMEKELASGRPREPSGAWHVNAQGQTLVVVPAGAEFWMGSPGAETGRVPLNEPLHRVRIPQSFAIAAREVTVEQFLRCRPAHRYFTKFSAGPSGPATQVLWYQAAEYCNWLSAQEGIPQEEWCYRPNRARQFDEGMRLAPGYLGKRGYRLPTEAEWEYACRAGAVTRRHYGDADSLLGEYAWYTKTTGDAGVQAGGLLKPNDLGLFDLYGNVWEWTQDPDPFYRWPGFGKPKEDIEYDLDISDKIGFVQRGGGFAIHALFVRSAHRLTNRPSGDLVSAGFRVARTCR
jgi:formylglycine-generating enzyme required for sulfatase activity/tRNA A-37 threonylcarbamoyl transferase component Bud32